jgi:hypothetical protein
MSSGLSGTAIVVILMLIEFEVSRGTNTVERSMMVAKGPKLRRRLLGNSNLPA